MLNKMLTEIVENYPDKTAIVYREMRITYRDLHAKILCLSRGFSSFGVKQGECISLILPNCPEFIISFFAAAKIGAVILPINNVLVEEEIKYYVDESDTVAIITDSQNVSACKNIIEKLNKQINLIVTGGDYPETVGFEYLVNFEKSMEQSENENLTSDDKEIIYQYSSGSTGRPKRVGKTQKNLYHEALNFHLTTDTTVNDNFLCVVPLFHAHGLGNCMLASLYVGATLVILEELEKDGLPIKVPFVLRRDRVLELMEREKISILPGVPFIFSALADTPEQYKINVASLRLCFSAGNFLSKEIYDKFLNRFSIPIRQLYGCTEVGSFSINLAPMDEFHFDSAGQPMKNNEVKIIDDSGNSLPPEAIGEVAIKSQALTSGYYNMHELNKAVFKDDFFLTGDIGKLDSKGYLYITGRKKIFIDTGGYKVDPLEIEDLLITHPKVKEVVVVGVKGSVGGEIVKAVVVPSEECKEQEVISFCRHKLASFKIPQIVEFRDEIPKSPLGKILRKNLI